jgi:hypothetical protein
MQWYQPLLPVTMQKLYTRTVCFVLCFAKDTCRIVPIGTHNCPTEPNRECCTTATNFCRIVLSCVQVTLVDVLGIENPHAGLKEY